MEKKPTMCQRGGTCSIAVHQVLHCTESYEQAKTRPSLEDGHGSNLEDEIIFDPDYIVHIGRGRNQPTLN